MADVDGKVRDWIADVTGGEVGDVVALPSGGRAGYFVDLLLDGSVHLLYLQQGRGLEADASSFQGSVTEAEVYRALRPHGIPVPRVWGVDGEHDLLLVDRVPGTVWFRAPADVAQQEAVAKDFIAHLAGWHSLDAATLDLPSFGPVTSRREHQIHQNTENERTIRAGAGTRRLDPLVEWSIEWLRDNVPSSDGHVVLVQGDTGPGNFLYEGSKVTGIIDWELAHLGDPMDDIAWLSWRAIQHGFPDFPQRMREYEQKSGELVDEARVLYYRLNAFTRLGPWFGLADMGEPNPYHDAIHDPRNIRAADGSVLIFATLHRRMRIEATAAAWGIELPPREVLIDGVVRDHAAMYDRILEQLSIIAAESGDRGASSLAKGVARQVKYLKEVDRFGNSFDEIERDEIGALLGSVSTDLKVARTALLAAARAGRVERDDYLKYHWHRVVRDDHLMRTASGAVYDRSWPALA